MTRPVVLLVEDDDDTRRMYAGCRELLGLSVREARDGREGVQRARELNPDVILMDIAMPRMNGLEATKLIRSDPAIAEIPVVVLTALTRPGDMERAFESGADDFLTKPCEPETVASRLLKHIHRRGGRN